MNCDTFTEKEMNFMKFDNFLHHLIGNLEHIRDNNIIVLNHPFIQCSDCTLIGEFIELGFLGRLFER